MDENKHKNKSWYKTWWGILILILFWPFSLSYFIWTRPWSTNKRIGFLAVLWIFVAIGMSINSQNRPQFTQPKQESATNTATPVVQTAAKVETQTPNPTVQAVATPEPDYNKNRGNNWVAAKYAEQMMEISNEAVPGSITDILLELSPEKTEGKDEEEYKKSVNSVFLSVEINNSLWRSWDDDSKKDLVAALVTSAGNIFPGAFPHVYVNNGTRRVAEGEYNLFKTEPKIILK